jgi:DNA polymerase III subunit alpha
MHSQKIRFGLSAIKGLGDDTVALIIAERKRHGRFKSLPDFAKRIPARLINKKTLEALAFSGSLDEFGDRKAIVDSIEEIGRFAREHQQKSESGQMGLFGGVDEASVEFMLKDTRATKEDILKWERESLGLFVSDHPLKGLGAYFQKYGHPIGTLNEAEDHGKKKTLHGLVTSVRKIVTKKGKNMAIFQIEDTTGKIECAVFPGVYEKIPMAGLVMDAFVRVKGKVEAREGTLNCIVDRVELGNLKDIQHSFASFEGEQREEIPVKTDQKSSKVAGKATEKASFSEEAFRLSVPTNTTKQQVSDLRALLLSHKSTNPNDRAVQICFQGQVIDLPFRVRFDAELERSLYHILN